ncbi:DUF5983 family protein [Serratia sp. DD3]|uniref:DUF5983 family protein n=1 Tax=Serratia sp. DD3 TaxID=1410619 RepID=UPI0003C4F15D|nr:DUF5983 family protein [Serratia sp. DD3]KEY59855.1 hypothetical protein SRDD_11940 [Serratia sp. DD3]KEY60209.1 hypothetical protein SRDD_08380 [Serratia sp. DD3]
MKIDLNIEADSILVLGLNRGRIAVDVDGIELAALIKAVNNHGYSLQKTSEPEYASVASPCSLPLAEGLQILIDWLQDNIDCDSTLIFDNDEKMTDSSKLLPCVEQALNVVLNLQSMAN